jgi:hypothetical protein
VAALAKAAHGERADDDRRDQVGDDDVEEPQAAGAYASDACGSPADSR